MYGEVLTGKTSIESKEMLVHSSQGKLLGHIVCKSRLKTDPNKARVIVEMEAPTEVSGVKSFLGHIGYYRWFIKNYARIALPLDKLTRKGEPYIWTSEQETVFIELKNRLLGAPILAYPNWDKEFHIHVDASNFAIGAMLVQTGDHGLDHPMYFASRLLSKVERNYSTTKREALEMVYSVQKFKHYPLATPFTFYVDYQALMYLVKKPIIQGRINRWLLLLQEFNFTIIVRPGKSHVIADQLSRIKSEEPPKGVSDDFPDAHLFRIVILPGWYKSIGKYLSMSQFLREMPLGE